MCLFPIRFLAPWVTPKMVGVNPLELVSCQGASHSWLSRLGAPTTSTGAGGASLCQHRGSWHMREGAWPHPGRSPCSPNANSTVWLPEPLCSCLRWESQPLSHACPRRCPRALMAPLGDRRPSRCAAPPGLRQWGPRPSGLGFGNKVWPRVFRPIA